MGKKANPEKSQLNMSVKKVAVDKSHLDLEATIKEIGKSYLSMSNQIERTSILRSVIRDSSKFPEIGTIYYDQGIASCLKEEEGIE